MNERERRLLTIGISLIPRIMLALLAIIAIGGLAWLASFWLQP